MPINRVLAALAVADVDVALSWYERLLGRPAVRFLPKSCTRSSSRSSVSSQRTSGRTAAPTTRDPRAPAAGTSAVRSFSPAKAAAAQAFHGQTVPPSRTHASAAGNAQTQYESTLAGGSVASSSGA
jgi:hypothetical protein